MYGLLWTIALTLVIAGLAAFSASQPAAGTLYMTSGLVAGPCGLSFLDARGRFRR